MSSPSSFVCWALKNRLETTLLSQKEMRVSESVALCPGLENRFKICKVCCNILRACQQKIISGLPCCLLYPRLFKVPSLMVRLTHPFSSFGNPSAWHCQEGHTRAGFKMPQSAPCFPAKCNEHFSALASSLRPCDRGGASSGLA